MMAMGTDLTTAFFAGTGAAMGVALGVAENPGAVAIEQPGCGMDETGRPRTPPPVDGGGNVMVLRSARPGEAIVRQLLAKYGIETALEKMTHGNLDKPLKDLIESGEELDVTDPVFPGSKSLSLCVNFE